MPNKQKGLALLMLVFVIALAIIAYSLKALNTADITEEKNKKTAEALAEAKAALIGWSVSHPIHPGIMPFPDRLENISPNYDGNSDCSAGMPNFNLLLGRLPFLGQTAPCAAPASGLASNLTDGEGEPLWYAVSRNLIRSSVVPVINSSISNAPAENWLVVRDGNGQVVSDRVAAVIIAPGRPVGNQDRSSGLAGPSAYLDHITISGTNYANDDYVVANENFINAPDRESVSSTDPRYLQPYEFNDKLIYITIDELIVALEKRVMGEAAVSLRNYYLASAADNANRYYPYAGNEFNVCLDGLLQGSLPTTICSGTTMNLDTFLPTWFTQNVWQNFIYYAVSADCQLTAPGCASGDITVGTQVNVDAVVISAGAVLPAQARPSVLVANYLDSPENTDGDNVFDAVGTALTNNYNDQMLIVAP